MRSQYWRTHVLFQVAQLFATACIPQEVLAALRVGRLTALQKPNGSVKESSQESYSDGSWPGPCLSSLGQPLSALATSPFQDALSTRARKERIAHVIQGLTDLDPTATVLSIDGIGTFNVVSRQAMLQGLQTVVRGGFNSTTRAAVLRVSFKLSMMASSTQSSKQKVVNRATH